MIKPYIIIVNRNYPSPGGRCTFINNLNNCLPYEVIIISKHIKTSKIYSSSMVSFFNYSKKQIQQIIRTKGKPLVVFGVGLSSYSVVKWCKANKIKTIVNLSDTNLRSLLISKQQSLRSFFGKKITSFFEQKYLSICDIITVPSNYSKISLLEDYPFLNSDKIKVIPEGVIISKTNLIFKEIRQKYGYSSKDIILLFPWISERKNVGVFCSVLPSLFQNTKLKVIFLGSKSDLSMQQQHLLDPYLSQIYFTGLIDINQKKEIFTLANLMVYIPNSEAHSCTVLEALNYNLPLVCSTNGWLKQELYSLNGKSIIFWNGDINELVYTINKGLKLGKIKSNLMLEKIIETYNLSIMIKEYTSLIKNANK